MAIFSVLTAFLIIKTSQVKKWSKEEKQTEWRKQRTTTAVFFRTFGVLPEVYFLHAIYHFKSQEVKNLTLQTVYDFELKWGRSGLRKTTAPGVCEIRTTPLNSHNTFRLCEIRTTPLLVRNLHQPMRGANSPLFLPTPHEIFSYVFFYVNSFLILVTIQS